MGVGGINTRSVVLAHESGIGSVCDALRQAGFSEAEVARHPQLVAWVAQQNGIQDFRTVAAGTSIRVPERASMREVLTDVNQHPERFTDGIAAVRRDLAVWKSKYAPEGQAAPGTKGLLQPQASGVGGQRSLAKLPPTPLTDEPPIR